MSERVERDMLVLNAGQEPVSQKITLYEAMARALAYNLDLRLELFKETVSRQELGLTRHDQLPKFVTNLSYSGRSNFTGASSRSLTTGLESLESSTSSEINVYSADIGLSWNVLDFGVSYYRAQQAADSVLIANEQRRKVLGRILQDVRGVYWRAVSNERLAQRVESLMRVVSSTLEDSREIEEKRLDTPLAALTYQRELIDIKRDLQELYQGLVVAKIQLASLMNLPLGEEYELVAADRQEEVLSFVYPLGLMEQLALENRSELSEAAYQKRINSKEAQAALLGLLPGINIDVGNNYNSNNFLFNTNWLSYGSQVSWNLLNIFKYPTTKKLTQAKGELLDAQRLALSMAVLTQVHIGMAQYELAKLRFLNESEYKVTQGKILKQLQIATSIKMASQQDLIREEMNALLAEVRYDVAYAEVERAYANSYASMGIEPALELLDRSSISSMAKSLEAYYEAERNRSRSRLLSRKLPIGEGVVE